MTSFRTHLSIISHMRLPPGNTAHINAQLPYNKSYNLQQATNVQDRPPSQHHSPTLLQDYTGTHVDLMSTQAQLSRGFYCLTAWGIPTATAIMTSTIAMVMQKGSQVFMTPPTLDVEKRGGGRGKGKATGRRGNEERIDCHLYKYSLQ